MQGQPKPKSTQALKTYEAHKPSEAQWSSFNCCGADHFLPLFAMQIRFGSRLGESKTNIKNLQRG
ncbi:kanadaptin-like protein [Corchorus olitorius]|uniref:Kanadaptin-like protein n=1 Tax=Corchorus olitorius TaxID=93759 RepID=A0A1R3KT50_9ROSI|nr:kanadaptin-like protein [Corchorus olitorius]